MKNNIIKYITVLAFAFLMASCSEDYLEETNPNGVSTKLYWKTLGETNSTLTAVYNALYDRDMMSIPDEALRADIGFPNSRSQVSTSTKVLYTKLFNNTTTEVENKWGAIYTGIFRANQVIEGLEQLEGTVDEVEWTLQMAQAKFFRGLFHFFLHSTFNNGSIIIKNSVPVSNADMYLPLSTSEEVVKFFREDLMYAYDNLPVDWSSVGSSDVGRATKGAAATALGTSHLYMEEYNLAAGYFTDIIDNYDYELVNDMSLMFTNAGEFNKESILEISYSEQYDLDKAQYDEKSTLNLLANDFGGVGSTAAVVPSAWLTWAYMNEPLDSLDTRNIISGSVADGDAEYRAVSYRGSASIALVHDLQTPYYLQPFAALAASFKGYKVSYFKKHTNHSITDNEVNVAGDKKKSGRNVVIYRLADVYLMLAECNIKTGNVDGALDLMNDLRERWALQKLGVGDGSISYDGKTYTAEMLMDHLMYIEKPLELSLEGHCIRSIDMRRWGITETRFAELAKEKYYAEDFSYLNPTTMKTAIKKITKLVKVGDGEGEVAAKPGDSKSIDILEYGSAAQNYDVDAHDYFAIPLTEEINNPNLNK